MGSRYVVAVNLGTGGPQDLGIPGVVDAVLVGSGGSSRVYRALQGQLGRVVAVKVLTGTAPAERKQFDRESKALGQLSSHPGIVSVYDAGFTANGDPYLLLEYCGGGSLTERLSHAVLPWAEAVGFLAPVAETLAHAHAQGLVHRDLKPGNILIDDAGRPLIADFGLARLIDAEASSGHASLAAFTPGYVPPETISGEPATTASDVYSLGGTLYSLLTGQVPFVDTESAMNIVALARRVAEEPVPDLRPMGFPAPVCALIEACMAKNPAERPTAEQLGHQLRTILGQGASSHAPASGGATTGNNTIHLSPEELARPIETVAPDLLGSHTIAPQAVVSQVQADAAPPVASATRRTSRRAQKRAQKAAVQTSYQDEQSAFQQPAFQQPVQSGAPYPAPQKRLVRTRALLLGVLVGLLALGLIVGGVVGYLLLRGEDLPTISFGQRDESSAVLSNVPG